MHPLPMEPNNDDWLADPPVRITKGDLYDIADLFERIWNDPIAAPIVNELFRWIPPDQNFTIDAIRGETDGTEPNPVGLEDLTVFYRACADEDPLRWGESP